MSDTLVLERIESNLSRLRLPRIREILQGVMKTAEEQGKSYLRFLDDLLEEDVAQKEQRRIETALKISGLPFIKSIDEFDFTFQPKLNRQKVMSLFDLTFIRQKGNIIFFRASRCREDPSCRIFGSKSLSGRHQHLFYEYGRFGQKTEKRL